MTAEEMMPDTGSQAPKPPAMHADISPCVRKNFTVTDDLILLRCANLVRPWEAAVGTANGIMKAFEIIAEKCRAVEGFFKKDGPALGTRFDRLVRMFREAQCALVRASSTTEEYHERDVLLQDIVNRMDNWKEMAEEERAKERARNQGMESSVELMRRLAMDEMDDDEPDEQGGGGDIATASSQKRAATSGSGRAQKASKREKLGAVTDGIALAIERSIGDTTAKYDYLRERLQFGREEATKKLEFEEKRMAAEQDRDARHEEAEQQRDRSNQEFMLKLLQIAMKKNIKTCFIIFVS